jgi:hypothetical protein
MDLRRSDYIITIEPGPLSGYFVRIDGHIAACFTNAADLARWIEREYAALDKPGYAPVLQSDDSAGAPERRGFMKMLRGGRS